MTKALPTRVALAGAGMISRHHLIAWKKLEPRVQVVAICDPDRDRAAARAKEFNIDGVYDTPASLFANAKFDALDVASPRETHGDWVRLAGAASIPVLCQKPLMPTLGEAETLIRELPLGARLMVHENWRFRPWYRAARQWVDEGLLGSLQMCRMSIISSGMLPDETGQRPALVRQPFMAAEHRLIIAEVLIHHIDVVRYLCGPMRVIGARTRHSLPEVNGETFASIFLETSTGSPVEVAGTMAAPGYQARACDRLEMIGDRASIVFDDWTLTCSDGASNRRQTFDADAGYQESFDATIAHFVSCLESGRSFETDAQDNIETLRLVEHAYWAAGQRPPV